PQAFAVYVMGAATVMAALALCVLMRPRTPGGDLAGGMMLAVAFTLLVSPHYAWYFAWLVPFLCFYPPLCVIYLTCACVALYCARGRQGLWRAIRLSAPSILILGVELAVRTRRKGGAAPADAVTAGEQG